MLFNSIPFVLFFIVFIFIYWIIPNKIKTFWILLASIFFYAFSNPINLFVPFIIIISGFVIGNGIEKSTSDKKKKILVFLGISINILLLIFYKYLDFILFNIFDIASVNYTPFNFLLPLGISYITFQAMGYILEIYRGNLSTEKNIFVFSSYLMYFPKLLAGPIERAENLLPQIRNVVSYNRKNIVVGLRLILWGCFKKIVIADKISALINPVYADIYHFSGLTLILTAVLFTFQLYFDFSGYIDMALGFSRLIGFKLTDNFNNPFSAKSMTDFWRRWHITLSSWLNEYLFTVIAINKRDWGKYGLVFACIVTFVLIGVWHGAGWNFLIFGLLQGIAVSYELLTSQKRKILAKKIPALYYIGCSVLITFCFFTFTLIFFRTTTLHESFYFVTHFSHNSDLSISLKPVIFLLFAAIFLYCTEWAVKNKWKQIEVAKLPVFVRWIGYYILVFLILKYFVGEQTFIYLKF